MVPPAPHLWNALIIHIRDGGSNLVQLLQKQGYELAEEWDGPTSWRALGQSLMEFAFLDLTQANQSGTVLFLQTVGQLQSPLVVIHESRDLLEGAEKGGNGRGFLLCKERNRQGPTAETIGPALGHGLETGPDAALPITAEMEHHLLQELKAQSSLRLASGIAHDVNNFLTVISACTALLQTEPLSAQGRSYVDDIHAASGRAATLLRQLANLCRPPLDSPGVLDLNQLILDLRCLISRLLGEEIELILDLEDHPCPVRADPAQLEQVLLNLAVNARDAMLRRGQFCIATATLHVAGPIGTPALGLRPEPCVQLSVTDTGCGMTEPVLARIFEPFFTTKDPGEGTGIGLATVEQIIRRYGGQIEVESAPGRGTTFRIYLPQAEGP